MTCRDALKTLQQEGNWSQKYDSESTCKVYRPSSVREKTLNRCGWMCTSVHLHLHCLSVEDDECGVGRTRLLAVSANSAQIPYEGGNKVSGGTEIDCVLSSEDMVGFRLVLLVLSAGWSQGPSSIGPRRRDACWKRQRQRGGNRICPPANQSNTASTQTRDPQRLFAHKPVDVDTYEDRYEPRPEAQGKFGRSPRSGETHVPAGAKSRGD